MTSSEKRKSKGGFQTENEISARVGEEKTKREKEDEDEETKIKEERMEYEIEESIYMIYLASEECDCKT